MYTFIKVPFQDKSIYMILVIHDLYSQKSKSYLK